MGKEKKVYWPLNKAIAEATKQGIEVSRPTLVKWINRHLIGFQLGGIGGKWYVYPDKFLRYINGGANESAQAQNKGTENQQPGGTDERKGENP